ncbi:MAG: hypothetical protein ACXVHK_32065 [Solirubrobacteraceae bacterium]
MPPQILSLKLDGITAGDYLTWCRDPEPPALGFALRSVFVDADPLGDTITAILDWNGPAPRPSAAATAAGLPLSAGAEIYPHHARPASTERPRHLTSIPTADAGTASDDPGQRLPRSVGVKQELRTAI